MQPVSRQHSSGGMPGLEPGIDTAENYRRFARLEAAGRSPTYARLAEEVARDESVLTFLDQMPVGKRQPNLLFAAARFLLGKPPNTQSLHALVSETPAELAALIHDRRTQTNEPARCAAMLPALAALPQPLALIEVGAAAGLTLLPDFYSYDYGSHRVLGLDKKAPTLTCQASGSVPFPDQVPEIVWRAGIDLNPLDVNDQADMDWLSCLIWPGEQHRAERLEAGAATARRHPPTLYKGDLVDDLPAIAAQAPRDATLVIYHTAVLAYVDEARRKTFAETVADLDAVWLSNEGETVLPNLDPGRQLGTFLLARDGTHILARTDPHGTWIKWINRSPAGFRSR